MHNGKETTGITKEATQIKLDTITHPNQAV
jgi:hypothetical protein